MTYYIKLYYDIHQIVYHIKL